MAPEQTRRRLPVPCINLMTARHLSDETTPDGETAGLASQPSRVHSSVCCSGGQLSVGVGAGLVFQPAGPEAFQGVAFAQRVGSQLQKCFARLVAEELFAPFHPDVDQLDRRFDVAAGQWQARLAVFRVVHPVFVVCKNR